MVSCFPACLVSGWVPAVTFEDNHDIPDSQHEERDKRGPTGPMWLALISADLSRHHTQQRQHRVELEPSSEHDDGNGTWPPYFHSAWDAKSGRGDGSEGRKEVDEVEIRMQAGGQGVSDARRGGAARGGRGASRVGLQGSPDLDRAGVPPAAGNPSRLGAAVTITSWGSWGPSWPACPACPGLLHYLQGPLQQGPPRQPVQCPPLSSVLARTKPPCRRTHSLPHLSKQRHVVVHAGHDTVLDAHHCSKSALIPSPPEKKKPTIASTCESQYRQGDLDVPWPQLACLATQRPQPESDAMTRSRGCPPRLVHVSRSLGPPSTMDFPP